MSDGRLKFIIERVERLIAERKGIGADIRDIFTEAKSAGYVPKAIRKVIVRRAMNAADLAEEDALIEAYEAAAGAAGVAAKMMAAGSTIDEAAAATRVPRSTVGSLRPSRNSRKLDIVSPPEVADLPTVAHDPETGEVRDAAPQPASEAPAGCKPPEQDADVAICPHAEPEGGGRAGDLSHESRRDGESRPVGHDMSDPERPNAAAARTAGVAPGLRDLHEAQHGTEPRPGPGGDASGTVPPVPGPARAGGGGDEPPKRMHGAAMGMGDARTFEEIAGPMPNRLRRTA